jgi:hypothetical protein
MDSSYRQEPLGDGRVRFTVTPAPVPRASGAPLVLAGIFVLVVLGTTTRDTNAFWMLVRLFVAGYGAWWIHRATNRWFASRVDKVRYPGGTFVISPSGVEGASGPSNTREQLHRLIVRNGVPEVQEAVVVNTGTVYSGMQSGAQNDRTANRAKAATVSYMLCAEAGGRSTTLAGGMTEVTAHGLLTDVSRVLNLGAS